MVNKPENTIEPAAGKGKEAPAAANLPQVELPPQVNVRQLADLLEVNSIQIIKQLMRSGIMANINQVIDYEAAAVVAKNLGFEPKPQARPISKRLAAIAAAKKATKPQGEAAAGLLPRPPVVTVMGHVDHGKTKLLDAIRSANVVATEAGGITQHIGAYQVILGENRITFLDTPGHEAFTAMRAHGAQITDITILVVAADDGVQPQTIEAINHAKAAGVPIVVAINKIDKPNANPEQVKRQLADAGLVIEEWGGDTIAVPISAKEKQGIDVLLENVLLVAEMLELKANPNIAASGVVIEAELDKSRGPVARILVQSGTLKVSDTVVVGTTIGRVRAMLNQAGKQVKKATPSTPVEILGLNGVPRAGDTLATTANEKMAQIMVTRNKAEQTKESGRALSLTNVYDEISAGKIKELNVVLKTDVQGSIEPIRTSLERLGGEEVKVRIIHAATGNISENDVMLALASQGLIIGFGVTADEGARRLASTSGIDIRTYNIIYTLIDDVEKALKGMLEPTFAEVIEGRADVRAVFPAGKGAKAAGSYITEGKATRGGKVRVRRGKEVLIESTINSLKRFKDDVREVQTGYECGIGVEGFNDFKVGDVLEFYKMEQISR
ncbi:MAG: translation initiation factor IF-2 [Dehalococcoidales bacterium]|nr:translation initiation factor IF-2 [Dehalococcoidales bacterium]